MLLAQLLNKYREAMVVDKKLSNKMEKLTFNQKVSLNKRSFELGATIEREGMAQAKLLEAATGIVIYDLVDLEKALQMLIGV